MAEPVGTPPGEPRPVQPTGERYLRFCAAWAAGALPAFTVITALWLYPSEFHGIGEISLGAFALMFPVAVRQLRVQRRGEFVYFLLFAGIAFAVVSILSGAANGLTDEPYTTPRYAALLFAHQDPYVVPLVFSYPQYGQTIASHSIYLYLPLLTFLQVPGLNYKWFALACWAGMVLVARRRFDVAVMLAQPYMVIIAASGYNDLVVLLLMTLGFLGWEGRRQKWAEWISLGCKQFANAFVIAYYVVLRDWRNTAITLGVSAAFIAPFLIWSGPAVICPAVFADRLPSCASGGAPSYLINYSVWVVWALALFYLPLVQALRRRSASGPIARVLARLRLSFDDLLRIPAFLVVGISGVFVNLCVFVLLDLKLGGATEGYLLASAGAFLVAMGWNYVWNRSWAFAGRGDRSTAYHLGVYGVIQAVALGINLVALQVGIDFGASHLDSQLVGILLGSVVGYAANVKWNFRAPSAGAAA